jgi:hypothetical protein
MNTLKIKRHPSLPPIEAGDYYEENGLFVFTAQYHLKRGYCCGSGCRHCPYRVPKREARGAGSGGHGAEG